MADHELILILGGARSGKSRFALELAGTRNQDVLFVATATPGDAEMAARIARHQAERPAHWRTVEAPQGVAQAIASVDAPATVVLDCVTLWVSNLLLAATPDGSPLPGAASSTPPVDGWLGAIGELEALLAWYQRRDTRLIVVSNEVGLGIVPGDALSRRYQDWLGGFNQRLAAEADAVYWLVAGLAVEVKALGARGPIHSRS